LNWLFAVRFTPAQYSYLLGLFISASRANKDNLDVVVSLDNVSLDDLAWWVNEANFSKVKGLLLANPDVYLSSDAFRTGWGAVCLNLKTGGPWTSCEPDLHIDALELLAALKALECFTSSTRDHLEIEVDNVKLLCNCVHHR
jgi:hypothetical protein